MSYTLYLLNYSPLLLLAKRRTACLPAFGGGGGGAKRSPALREEGAQRPGPLVFIGIENFIILYNYYLPFFKGIFFLTKILKGREARE